MNPFEPRRPTDANTRQELERLESATKSKVFGLSHKEPETAAMRESWVLFAQLLDAQSTALDVPAAVTAIEERLQARRHRKLIRWSSGLVGLAAAACIAVAVWPESAENRNLAKAPRIKAVEPAVESDSESTEEWTWNDLRPWRDRLDDNLVVTWEAVEDLEYDFRESPSALNNATNQALALARDFEESTL